MKPDFRSIACHVCSNCPIPGDPIKSSLDRITEALEKAYDQGYAEGFKRGDEVGWQNNWASAYNKKCQADMVTLKEYVNRITKLIGDIK